MIRKGEFFIIFVILPMILQGISSWCLKTQFSDTDKINSIDFSRDGSKIVTSSNSDRVIVWDAHTLEQLFVYNFTVNANTAKFSKDGLMIAVGGITNNIHIIRVSNYGIITTSLNSNQIQVFQIDFSEDNTRMTSCGRNNQTYIYSVSGTTVTYLSTSGDKLGWNLSCRFLRNDTFIAMGDRQGDVYILTFGTSSITTVSRKNQGGQWKAVDWNDITQQAYFGGTIKKLVVLHKNGNILRTTTLPKQIYTISVSKDGAYAAVGGQDGPLFMYNIAAGSQILQDTFTDTNISLTASAFSYDGEYLITGNSQGMMFMYKRICSGCPVGTYVNVSECRPCNADIPGCYLCTNGTTCLGCSNGYYLDTNLSVKIKLCKPCSTQINGCNLCSSDIICTSCVLGFFLDSGSSRCQPCWDSMKGCLMCNASNSCFQCGFRYYLNATNQCMSCTNSTTMTNCLSCNSSSYCLDCVQGYYLNGLGSCTLCPKNCTNCINITYCTQCDNQFYLTATGTCDLCTVKGCLSCNSSNYCFDCIQSMYQVNPAGTCAFCTPPCLECSTSATTCETCILGYYLSTVTACSLCTSLTQGCIVCKGSNAATDCLACATGYYLNSANKCTLCSSLLINCVQCNSTTCSVCRLGYYYDTVTTSCKTCIKGCLTCVNPTVCLSCQVDYYHTLSDNTCTVCPPQCSACQSPTLCTSCNPKYFHKYISATDQTCQKCSVSNCVTCRDQTKCLTCLQGYFIDNSGALCRACSVNITNCLSCYNQSYCKSCELGYYLPAANSTCVQCMSPCSTCSKNDCFTCELGYFLTTASPKTCSSCPKQCLQCTTLTNCTKCVPGYYHDSANDKCLPCSDIQPGCRSCNDTVCFSCKSQIGYFRNSTDNSCPLCSAHIINCLSCESQTNCVLCNYGYTFVTTNNTCLSCSQIIPSCQNCLNTTDCHTCLKGYYLDINNDCKLCSQGCSTCNDSSNCQICLREFVLQTNLSCTLCELRIIGCQMCTYNPTIKCTNCITGYYISSTTCNLCSFTLQGCSICNDSSICLTCSSGYYHTTLNKCKLCSFSRPNCQLCSYNPGTALIDCLECTQSYFLNGTHQCQLCTDTACLSCSDSTTCTYCQSGFYLSSGDCLKCLDLYPGCILCNTTACLQCGSGYYLDTSINQCKVCHLDGCQLCSQIIPVSKCLVCNSQYYLTITQTCQLCRVPLPNCLQCSDTSACQICESGYFINSSLKCQLCNNKFDGCSLCSPSLCLQCESGYLLGSSDLCQLCNQFIPGCSFCLSSSTCISCESGYYAENNTCFRCSDLIGCLQCKNSTTCIFCDYGYYIQNDTCRPCKQAIQNCVACASSHMCVACLGNFILSAGTCNQLKGQSFPIYEDIKLITEYVSSSQLKHTLQSTGRKIYQIDLDWTVQSKLYILDQNYKEIALRIKRTQFNPNGYSLIFYSDNPLGSMVDITSLNSMPLLARSTLQPLQVSSTEHENRLPLLARSTLQPQQVSSTEHENRLLASVETRLKTKIQMTQQGFNSLFPTAHHTGTFFMKYKLSQPQFYRSVINVKTYYYQYFGLIISIVLIVLYFLKATIIVQDVEDKGEIIPHILCYKMMAFIIYPLYGQYLNYCKGFMYLDFPWLNGYMSETMTIDTDRSPQTYKLFYSNLNIPSTYFFALNVVLVLYVAGYVVLNYMIKDGRKWQSYKGYLYNLFISGSVTSSFLALQGAYYNPVDSISLNSLFYIFGIAILVSIILETVNSIYKSIDRTLFPFDKPRIILKCMALSLSHANPLYIFMSLIFLDVCLLIIEYIIKKDRKIRPKLWLFNNILADIGLCFMMLGAYSLASIYMTSLCIVTVIGIDIFIMLRERAQIQQIRKVKLHQNQLIMTMEALQKQNKRVRCSNHQIHLKNKVLEDFQIQNSTNFNQAESSMYNQNLFFEEKDQQIRPDFQTIPIAEDQNQNFQEMKVPQQIRPKKRALKANLRSRKKQQKKDWDLQESNVETFVLAEFQ